MHICSHSVLANTETQTGIIHTYTSEHTQVARTQTQVLNQVGTLLVRVQHSAPFLEAIPQGFSVC